MRILFLFLLVFINVCVTVYENQDGRIKPMQFSVCFLNAENLNWKKFTNWEGRSNFLSKLIKNCDSISLTALNIENKNIAPDLEEVLDKEGSDFSCLDSVFRRNEFGQIIDKTKYTTCVNKNKVIEVNAFEFPEARNDFVSPPSFFFLELMNGAKVSLLPFHARYGSKSELIDFERIVNFSYQNYSDRKTFFGGDFYLDKKYHSESFLKSLLYFRILKNLISVPTTITGEKNDSIFTDNVTSLNCSGAVLQELNNPEYLQMVSSHIPVIAKCKIK